jgi:hypothetical protein
MAKKGVSVGVEITGTAKGFKAATEDAKRASDELRKKAAAHSREIEQSFKMVTIAMAKVAGAVIVAKKAFEVYASVMKSTGGTADQFEATIEGVRQGFDSVKRALATLDFKDFVKNVKAAIDEGKRYAQSLDDLDEKSRALKIAEADASNEILKQKIIQNSALSTNKQKIAAGERILELEKQLEGIRSGIARQAYENEIINIASITKLTNEEAEAYLRGEKAIKDKIAAGEAYNKNTTDLAKLNMITVQGIKLTDSQAKLYQYLKEQLKGVADAETLRFAFAAKMMVTDEKLNLAVEKYVGLQEAARSADENTLRVQTKLNSEYDKGKEALSKYSLELKKAFNLPEATTANIKLPTLGTTPELQGLIGAPKYAPTSDQVTEALKEQQKVVDSLTTSFEALFTAGMNGWKALGEEIINQIKRIAAELLAKAAVFALLKIFFPEIFIGTGAMSGVSFGKFLLGGLAEGGVVSGPALAKVGEYPGARSNPEVVAPLSTLKGMIGFNSPQRLQIEIEGKLKGTDLLISMKRASIQLARST